MFLTGLQLLPSYSLFLNYLDGKLKQVSQILAKLERPYLDRSNEEQLYLIDQMFRY